MTTVTGYRWVGAAVTLRPLFRTETQRDASGSNGTAALRACPRGAPAGHEPPGSRAGQHETQDDEVIDERNVVVAVAATG